MLIIRFLAIVAACLALAACDGITLPGDTPATNAAPVTQAPPVKPAGLVLTNPVVVSLTGKASYTPPKNQWNFGGCRSPFAAAAEAAGLGHIDNTARGGCVLKVAMMAPTATGQELVAATITWKPEGFFAQERLFCYGPCNGSGNLGVVKITNAQVLEDGGVRYLALETDQGKFLMRLIAGQVEVYRLS